MQESEEIQTLKKIATILQDNSIPYMLTGSMALSFYAMPRMTRDIDIVVAIHSTDLPTLGACFKEGFFFQAEAAQRAVASGGMFNILDLRSMVKVDFIVKRDSPYQKQAFDRRKPFEIAGMPVFVITPEDLILSKLDWARDSKSELQLKDIKNISASVSDLDRDYLGAWASKLGLSTLYEEALR